MNSINKHRFQDLNEIASGISSSQEQAGHGTPFVSFSTVFNNVFLPDELPDKMDTTEKEQENCSVRKGDVFLTRTSETIDELAMSCVAAKDYPRATFSGFLKRLRPKTKDIAYHKYLAFYLRGYLFRKAMNNNAFMTLRASFNEDIFSYLYLYLPPYEQQVLIGDLFYIIEEKIRLNQKMCVELESMAKTLYDYWFVQFDFPDEYGKPYRTSGGKMIDNSQIKIDIPDGWKVGNLYEIADFINGLACQKYRPEIGEEGLPVIKIKEMHDGITGDTEFVSKNIPNKYVINDGELLFSWSATLETMFWYGGEGGLNQHIFKVVPKESYPIEYVYEQLSAYIINFVKMAEARKTTMGHITTDHLNQSRIVLPPPDVLERFSLMVKPIYQKVGQLKKENRTLSLLRDWLLPMLMNGQVTVVDKEETEVDKSKEASAPTVDPRFTKWLDTMGLAARGTVDQQTLLDIFNAMDKDDKQ